MIFLCYPKCSTCQKAQKWLDANGEHYKLRNIKDNKPTEAELRAWHKLSGMTEDEMYALLATDGMLVKRPMLIADDFVLVGFKEPEWAKTVKHQ